MELKQERFSFSSLIGTRVEDQGGRTVGRVREVRARCDDGQLVFEELLVGRRSLLRRLRGPGPDAKGIAWNSVVELGPDRIVVEG